MEKELHYIIFKYEDWWIAQCLEYDIAVQSKTVEEAHKEFKRNVDARIAFGKKLGVEPFNIPKPPKRYQDILKNKNEKEIYTMTI